MNILYIGQMVTRTKGNKTRGSFTLVGQTDPRLDPLDPTNRVDPVRNTLRRPRHKQLTFGDREFIDPSLQG